MGILALWATPRTVSTAFERMMIERGDHVVLDEPWSRAYYLGPDRRSGRFPLCFPESTYEAIREAVLALGRAEQVFVKDMAYQAAPGLRDEDLASMTHTFLIRDPRSALASLAREWPDFTEDEAGYAAQAELFARVRRTTGGDPVVIDSDDLRRDPAGVVARWCARVGIEFREDALAWPPGMRAEWPLWREWYEGVAASRGFLPLRPADGSPRPPGQVPAIASGLLERAVECHAALAAHALTR